MTENQPSPGSNLKIGTYKSLPSSNGTLNKFNLKLVLSLFLSVTLLIITTLYIHNSNWRVGVKLIFSLKFSTPHNDTAILTINGRKTLRAKIKNTKEFQEIEFLIPPQKIDNMRLSLGRKADLAIIKKININNPLNHLSLKGKRLQLIFRTKKGVKEDYIKNHLYYIDIGDSLNLLKPVRNFYKLINRQQQDKTSYYLISLFLSILFFYFFYFFKPVSLGILLKPKLLINGGLVFLLVIFLPIVDQTFAIFNKSSLVEKRKLAVKPELRLDNLFNFSKAFNDYYNDHFKFRGEIIYLYNLIKVKWFNVSPTPRVLVGKDGWLFFDQPDLRPGTVDYYRSLTPFSPEELHQWKEVLEHRYRWLSRRGVLYLFVIAPNKNTIYPEFMPDHIRKVRKDSRMDQLVEYLKRHSRVPLLDLRQPLRKAKKKYPVYSKTDTHWNDFGAYIAYREIIKYLSRYFEGAKPLPLSRYQIDIDDHMGGDLAIMLSLHDKVLREEMVFLNPLEPLAVESRKLPRLSRFVRQGETRCKEAPLPDILMVHDSFYHRLRPFLSQSFSRVHYIWDWNFNFYPEIITQEKPKLVIDEMAERFLMGRIPPKLDLGNLHRKNRELE